MIRKSYNDLISVPEWVLHSAFRYALGRMTYIVGSTAEIIIIEIPTLSDEMLHLIFNELQDTIAYDLNDPEAQYLGHKQDADLWRNVYSKVENEITRRKAHRRELSSD